MNHNLRISWPCTLAVHERRLAGDAVGFEQQPLVPGAAFALAEQRLSGICQNSKPHIRVPCEHLFNLFFFAFKSFCSEESSTFTSFLFLLTAACSFFMATGSRATKFCGVYIYLVYDYVCVCAEENRDVH